MSQKKYSELSISVLALKAEGQSYEDLFCEVMVLKDSRFQKIKAHGNTGDMKNDGYIPELGHYYQVYAPSDISKTTTINSAVNKLENDFEGLYKKWNHICQVRCFSFVINDKSKGIPPQVSQKIQILKSKYKDIEFKIYDFNSLVKDFLELDLPCQSTIIGYIPTGEIRTIEYPVLKSTIENIKNNFENTYVIDESLDFEEFNNKIQFNNIDNTISELLLNAETQVHILESYFRIHSSKNLRNLIGGILNYKYETIKEEYGSGDGLSSNLIFYTLLKECCIDNTLESKNASLVLLSFYFVSCDIFEKPSKL